MTFRDGLHSVELAPIVVTCLHQAFANELSYYFRKRELEVRGDVHKQIVNLVRAASLRMGLQRRISEECGSLVTSQEDK